MVRRASGDVRTWGRLGLFVVLVAACGESECLETMRVVGYDEILSDGDSAKQLMAAVAGEMQGSLQWRGGGDEVDVYPAAGSTKLTLALVHEGGEVALIERQEHDLAPNERLLCSDELVIPATLTLTTEDGALAGSWAVEARYTPGSGTSLGVAISPFGSGNAGDFLASLVHPEDWDPGTDEVGLLATFGPTGVTGDITLHASRDLPTDGDVHEGFGLDATLATWDLPRP